MLFFPHAPDEFFFEHGQLVPAVVLVVEFGSGGIGYFDQTVDFIVGIVDDVDILLCIGLIYYLQRKEKLLQTFCNSFSLKYPNYSMLNRITIHHYTLFP